MVHRLEEEFYLLHFSILLNWRFLFAFVEVKVNILMFKCVYAEGDLLRVERIQLNRA